MMGFLDTETESTAVEKRLIEQWIHLWGNAASEAVLDTTFSFFRLPPIEGLIGYRIVQDYAVVIGDPICPRDKIPDLTRAFHLYCEEKKLNIIYIIASEEFAKWATEGLCRVMIEVGEELVFDPQFDPTEGAKGNRLRNKVSFARRHGLIFQEYLAYDPKLEHSILQVGEAWLKARRGPQLHLGGSLNFFDDRTYKRWFYVKNEKAILGMAVISKLDAQKGWLLKFLMGVPGAPRGTTELLMTSILATLRGESCHFLTYGMVPAKQLGEVEGLSKFSIWLAKNIFKIAKWVFNLDQRRAYWQKYRPQTARTFVLFDKSTITFKAVQAIIRTLNGNL